MIINESIRLYPPVVSLTRESLKEVRLGQVVVPANVELHVTNLALHHEPKYWGKDMQLFKPERFSEGLRQLLTTTQLHSCFTGREEAAKEMHVINDKQVQLLIESHRNYLKAKKLSVRRTEYVPPPLLIKLQFVMSLPYNDEIAQGFVDFGRLGPSPTSGKGLH